MKKTILFNLLISFIFFASCTQKNNFSPNELEGTWEAISLSEISVFSEPGNDASYEADVTTKKTVELYFSPLSDKLTGSYTLSTVQNVSDYRPVIEKPLLSKEFVTEQLLNKIEVSGKYKVNKRKVSFTAEEVTLSDGNKISFDDYSSQFSDIGPKTSSVNCLINGEKLILKDSVIKENEISYTRKKAPRQ